MSVGLCFVCFSSLVCEGLSGWIRGDLMHFNITSCFYNMGEINLCPPMSTSGSTFHYYFRCTPPLSDHRTDWRGQLKVFPRIYVCAIVLAFVGIEFEAVACFDVAFDLVFVLPGIGVLRYHFILGLLNPQLHQFPFHLGYYLTRYLIYVVRWVIRDYNLCRSP